MERSRDRVRATYDEIAEHFAATREVPWPEVTDFLDEAPAGTTGLDLGCANGRHLDGLAARVEHVIGIDLSRRLLTLASEQAASIPADVSLVQADASTIPLADDTVDLAVYIATLHHLPTPEARRASLDDLARILTPDGQALISVWSTVHDRFEQTEGFDTTIDWERPDGTTEPRYYHIYDPEEFRDVLAESALTVVEFDISSGNCYATVTVES